MRRAYAVLLALCLALAGALATAGPAQAAPLTITNGTQFTDTGGQPRARPRRRGHQGRRRTTTGSARTATPTTPSGTWPPTAPPT